MGACVYETESAMVKNEIEDCTNYMGRWAVCGSEKLVFLHKLDDS